MIFTIFPPGCRTLSFPMVLLVLWRRHPSWRLTTWGEKENAYTDTSQHPRLGFSFGSADSGANALLPADGGFSSQYPCQVWCDLAICTSLCLHLLG